MVSTRSHHRKAAPTPSTPLALPDRRRTRSRRTRSAHAGEDSVTESVQSSLVRSELSTDGKEAPNSNEHTSEPQEDMQDADKIEGGTANREDPVIVAGSDLEEAEEKVTVEKVTVEEVTVEEVTVEEVAVKVAVGKVAVEEPATEETTMEEEETVVKDVTVADTAGVMKEVVEEVRKMNMEVTEGQVQLMVGAEDMDSARQVEEKDGVTKEPVSVAVDSSKVGNRELERTSPSAKDPVFSAEAKRQAHTNDDSSEGEALQEVCPEKQTSPVASPSAVDTAKKGATGPSLKGAGPDAAFSLFSRENAGSFLRRDRAVSRACRELLSGMFAEQTNAEFGNIVGAHQILPQRRKRNLPPLGSLPAVCVGDEFDSDQIWEQIELRNKPLLSHVQRRIRRIQASQKLLNEEDELKATGAQEAMEVGDADSEKQAVEVGNGPSHRNEGSSSSTDAGDGLLIEAEGDDEAAGPASPKRRVTFAADSKGDPSVSGGPDRTVAALDDGFFNLADMEMFADDAEQLAMDGKLADSDDEGSDDDSREPEAEPVSEGGSYREKPHYADFFDPPADTQSDELRKQERVSELLGDDDNRESLDEGEVQTPLTVARSLKRRMIDAIEEENVSKKPWQLTGEVRGHSRPKDSLLDTTLDHDTSVRPKAFLDSDKNNTIEDLIRQRIVDGLFDDVADVGPDAYMAGKTAEKAPLPEVSQEKPTEGLAEVYAREYVDAKEKTTEDAKPVEVRREKEVTANAEQKEVNRLFEKLSKKLDALSGLHFAPALGLETPEMTVRGNVRAIASEEAIPEAVSDTNILAPREVYTADHKDMKGDKETTKEERRASRGRAKQGIRKANSAKARAAQLMQNANPALGEKKRSEMALLRRGKKVRVAKESILVSGDAKGAFAFGKKIVSAEADREKGQDALRASSLKL